MRLPDRFIASCASWSDFWERAKKRRELLLISSALRLTPQRAHPKYACCQHVSIEFD